MAGYQVKVAKEYPIISWASNRQIWLNIRQIAEPLGITRCLVSTVYWHFVATGDLATQLAGQQAGGKFNNLKGQFQGSVQSHPQYYKRFGIKQRQFMFLSQNYNGKVCNSCQLIHFPEQPWLTPSLVQAGIIATHLGLSLHDLIKKRFVRRQQHTSIEMSGVDGRAGK